MLNKLKIKIKQNLEDKHFSEILTGSVMSFGIKILSVAFGLIINLIIAKYYGAEILGTLTLLISIISIVSMISLAGTDVSILRFIPPLLIKNEYNEIYEIIKKIFMFIISLSILFSVIIYIFSDFIADVIFEKPKLSFFIGLIAFFIFFQVIGKFSIASIRAFKNIKLYLFLQFLPALANLSILSIITFFYYTQYNPIYSQLATQTMVAIVSIWFLKKYLFRYNVSIDKSKTTFRELITISFPMFLTAVMQIVVLQTDVLMLSHMSTLEYVGIYSIVMKLALLSSFIITSINTIIAPKFSELYYNKNMDELKNISKKSTKLIFYTTLPITIVLIVFGEELLSIFGEKFMIGSFALILLASGQLVNAMAGSVGYFLNMTGHQKTLNKIVLLGGISNIILNILLIPNYGINGAALASMISMILWNLLASFYVKKHFGFFIGYLPIIIKVRI